MPTLTPEDRKTLLGPTNHTCDNCRQPVYQGYCRQCDEFFLDCLCHGEGASKHVGHRVYSSGAPYEKPVDQRQVRAGVGVIVCKGDRVLVGKRVGSHGEGCWAFPGGHIEPTDPTLRACGEREVEEETGIVCVVISPDGHRDDLFTTYDILSEDGGRVYVTCYLMAEYIDGGEPVANDPLVLRSRDGKCEAWHWLTLTELETRVCSPKEKTWIPIEKVKFYLSENPRLAPSNHLG